MIDETVLVVHLTPEQIADAEALGQATFERWQSARGHYWNTLASHRKGKLGEIAVETWADEQRQIAVVESWFRDPERERDADLRLNMQRFDVKTWDVSTWQSMGRCVRPGQINALRRKAEGIVWCIVDEAAQAVGIAGWSTVGDVAALPVTMTGRPGRLLENHQVPLDGMRDMDSLLATL
jgi:hypothetical protein